MHTNIPPELILRILKVLSRTAEESIIYNSEVDTDAWLALLKCTYVSRSFSNPSLQTINKTALIRRTEAAQAYLGHLTTLGRHPSYPLHILAIEDTKYVDRARVTANDFEKITKWWKTIHRISIAFVDSRFSSPSQWLSCRPNTGET